MRLKLFLSTILLLATLTGCGKFAEKFGRLDTSTTEVTIARPKTWQPGQQVMVALTGGLLVYAQNVDVDGRRGSVYMSNEASGVTWSIPTARYRFYVVGYTSTNDLTGTVHCGFSDPVLLDGSPRTIQLTASSVGCGGPPFVEAGWGTAGQPYPLKVAYCNSGEDMTSLSIGSTCLSAGPGSDIQIDYPEFRAWNGEIDVNETGPSNDLSTACITGLTAGMEMTTGEKLITGVSNESSPFVVGVNRFTPSSCSSVHHLYGFGLGLAHFFDQTKMIFEYNQVPYDESTLMTRVGFSGGYIHVYAKDF